ncbi:MAG: XdhC family protein [Bradymonadaceae bacterium]
MAKDFWVHVLAALDRGETVFLAHVVANSRHSPGTRGACLCLHENGKTWGTIGGGIMEKTLINEGLAALQAADYPPRLERLHHRQKADGKLSGLTCAGHQTNLYHICHPSDGPLLKRLVELLEDDRPGRLTYSRQGLAIDESHVPDPHSPPIVVKDADDENWRVEEELLNWKRVAIIGGGHCGLALSRVMSQLGYTVTVFDARPNVFTFCNNSYARHRIVVDDYKEAGDLISAPLWTHVVVMTSDGASDIRGLLGVVGKPFPYIGVMGAPAKIQRVVGALRAENIDDDAIEALYAPIGLPMTSNTPEEVAISVASEILQERTRHFSFTGVEAP